MHQLFCGLKYLHDNRIIHRYCCISSCKKSDEESFYLTFCHFKRFKTWESPCYAGLQAKDYRFRSGEGEAIGKTNIYLFIMLMT